jgi:hypothetical protein
MAWIGAPCYAMFLWVALVIEKEEELGKEEKEEEEKEERIFFFKMWDGDGNMKMEFHGTITMSSKFTWTSLKLAKLGRIGKFVKFVIGLG